MRDEETTTENANPTADGTGTEAAGEQGFDEMCRGLLEMGQRMMAGGMADCCRPGASQDTGRSEADKMSSE